MFGRLRKSRILGDHRLQDQRLVEPPQASSLVVRDCGEPEHAPQLPPRLGEEERRLPSQQRAPPEAAKGAGDRTAVAATSIPALASSSRSPRSRAIDSSSSHASWSSGSGLLGVEAQPHRELRSDAFNLAGLAAVLARFPSAPERLLVVGHGPDLAELIEQLTGDAEGPCDPDHAEVALLVGKRAAAGSMRLRWRLTAPESGGP